MIEKLRVLGRQLRQTGLEGLVYPDAQGYAPLRAAIASLNPLIPVRKRFENWWMARRPLNDTLTLTQRNVYILPTGAGWMLAD